MPAKIQETEEQVFNAAFDDAAKAHRDPGAEAAAETRETGRDATPSVEPAAGETAAEAEIENTAPAPEGGNSEEEPEPDYKSLYEREIQRFKSFEGRYRKEKQAWERERRELMNLLQREGGEDGNSPESAGEQSMGLEQNRSDTVEAAGSGRDEKVLAEVVRKETKRLMEPLVAAIEAERHRSAVAAAHPDFERLAGEPDLQAWIEEQPDYIARSLRDVVERGTAGEVIDLLDRYKQERGKKSARAKAEQNRAQAERLAQEATAVRSKSAGPPKEKPSADDFAGAWAEAVSKGA